MASYSFIVRPSVEKDLRSLPASVARRLFEHMAALQNNPFPRGSLKLTGAEQLYRVRVGDYRMIYAGDQDNRQVVVYYVRHRRDAYRQL